MAEVTASMVKELREKTGAGMLDCRNALAENNGDMEAAIDWLRAKGLSKAAKKSDRVAAEGLVAVEVTGTTGGMVEINSETDFVSRNDQFQAFAHKLASLQVETGGDVEALRSATPPQGEGTIADQLTSLIATIGENMALRRVATVTVPKGAVVSYVHNAVAPGLGKIGVLVGLKSDAAADVLEELGKKIAMHIAATAPRALDRDSLDPADIERERTVLIEQAKESGKTQEIAEKMVEGRLRKFYEEVVLMEQAFVFDTDTTIKAMVADTAKQAGSDIKLSDFAYFKLGEGIEKAESDFAAEVKQTLAG